MLMLGLLDHNRNTDEWLLPERMLKIHRRVAELEPATVMLSEKKLLSFVMGLKKKQNSPVTV
ncbi:MAG: hypothetical protein GXY52_05570 [Chloroflexi bacterium]|nr:hypothetical protein [Chloroflexota bacterium]